MTLPEALQRWARDQPEALALQASDCELSYRDLAKRIETLQRSIAGAGVGPGDRVAILGPNSGAWVVGFLAVIGMGGIAVPLNVRLSTAELGRQVQVARATLALGDREQIARIRSSADVGPRLAAFEPDGADSIWNVRGAPAAGLAPEPDDPALISFTSGTTGPPKGAVISHGALAAAGGAFVEQLGTGPGDGTLVLVPLFHNTGFADQVAHLFVAGGSVSVLDRFSVSGAVEALAARSASYLIAVPSIYRLLLLAPGGPEALRGTRIAAYGGEPMRQDLIEDLRRELPALALFNVYGLTEFTSVSHLLPPECLPEMWDSVGFPVPGVEHRVVDDADRPLPVGQAGEVQLSGPTRMREYWWNEAATERAFCGEWLRTGDRGVIAGDGSLSVLGRIAEVINRGGEKIHAGQVEQALGALPVVREAAVVGLPHPVFGEQVVGCLVLEGPDEAFDADAVRAHLAKALADYAVPAQFLSFVELPLNASGKVDRAELRALAAERLDTEGTKPGVSPGKQERKS